MTPDEIPTRDQVFMHPWLGAYLHQLEVSQRCIALALHVDPSVIALWANGTRPVPHKRLDRLAWALGMDTPELLEHARIVVDGYPNETGIGHPYRMPEQSEFKVNDDAVAMLLDTTPRKQQSHGPAPAEPPLPPSVYPLRWCASMHGTGAFRVHHHGPRPSWAPRVVTSVEALA